MIIPPWAANLEGDVKTSTGAIATICLPPGTNTLSNWVKHIIIYEGSQNAFLDATGTTLEDRNLVFLSFDQQFGEHFAGWIRFGWGDDDAAVDASNLYSRGVNIGGGLWGRGEDIIGIG